MSALLLGTEANEGLGHVAPWSGFVERAVLRGWRVHVGAPNVGVVQRHLGQHPIAVWSAPLFGMATSTKGTSLKGIRSWVELLVSLGYADEDHLLGAVHAWRSILGHVQPQVVLADYAPSLILAAHTMGIKVLEVGIGFCVPPLHAGLEVFPGASPSSNANMLIADQALTSAFNTCLARFDKSAITSFTEVASWCEARLVTSAPELDHYGIRDQVAYLGPRQYQASKVAAPEVSHPPIVGYLKANTPGLREFIAELVAAEVPASIYIPNRQTIGIECEGCVQLLDAPLDLQASLSVARVFITNGGQSGVEQGLQLGCWPLLLPQQAEQVAMARNLLQRQWASVWLPGQEKSLSSLLLGLLRGDRQRERRFAIETAFAEDRLMSLVGPAHQP